MERVGSYPMTPLLVWYTSVFVATARAGEMTSVNGEPAMCVPPSRTLSVYGDTTPSTSYWIRSARHFTSYPPSLTTFTAVETPHSVAPSVPRDPKLFPHGVMATSNVSSTKLTSCATPWTLRGLIVKVLVSPATPQMTSANPHWT